MRYACDHLQGQSSVTTLRKCVRTFFKNLHQLKISAVAIFSGFSHASLSGIAVEHSVQRAIVAHGTHRAHFENIAIYDVLGSAVYVEAGNEMWNSFEKISAICHTPHLCVSIHTDHPEADGPFGAMDNGDSAIWLQSKSQHLRNIFVSGYYRGINADDSRVIYGKPYDPAYGKVKNIHYPIGTWENLHIHASHPMYLGGGNGQNPFYSSRRVNAGPGSNGYLRDAPIAFEQAGFSSVDPYTVNGGDNALLGIISG